MPASQPGLRAALTAAVVVLPLVGACASLIGLEDAAVDDGTSSGTLATGTESTGTETSGTESNGTLSGGTESGGTESSPASSSTGDGGASSNSGAVGSGGDGGGSTGSGAGGPLGDLVELPSVDGTQLEVLEAFSDDVLLLGTRRDDPADGPCFETLQAPPNGAQAVVWRVNAAGACIPLKVLEGDELQVTSLHARYDTPTSPLTLTGTYRGFTTIEGTGFVTAGDDHGIFALTTQVAGTQFVATHIVAGEDAGVIDPEVVATWAFPDNDQPLGMTFGGAVESCDQVSCINARYEKASVTSYVGHGYGTDACESDPFFSIPVKKLIAAVPHTENDKGGVMLQLEPDLVNTNVKLSVVGVDRDGPGQGVQIAKLPPDVSFGERLLGIRHVPVPDDGYYVIVGESPVINTSDAICVKSPLVGDGPKPFLAVVSGGTGSLGCEIGLRPPPIYQQLVAGIGNADEVVVAARNGVTDWDLLKVSRGTKQIEDTRADFCVGCSIADIAMTGTDVWILGHSVADSSSIMGRHITSNETFVFHIAYADLFLASGEN